MSFKPLNDRVVLKPEDDGGDVTAGGVVIPDTGKEKPQQGVVVAVGPGRQTDEGGVIAPSVKAGQVVVYSKYAGTEVKQEGQEFVIVRESDILAIVE